MYIEYINPQNIFVFFFSIKNQSNLMFILIF